MVALLAGLAGSELIASSAAGLLPPPLVASWNVAGGASRAAGPARLARLGSALVPALAPLSLAPVAPRLEGLLSPGLVRPALDPSPGLARQSPTRLAPPAGLLLRPGRVHRGRASKALRARGAKSLPGPARGRPGSHRGLENRVKLRFYSLSQPRIARLANFFGNCTAQIFVRLYF